MCVYVHVRTCTYIRMCRYIVLLCNPDLHPMHMFVYTMYIIIECMFITYYIYYYHNPEVDFVSIDRQIITFAPNETRKVYNITIIDDVIPEDSEFFNLDVNLADSSDARFVTIGTPKQPLVEILDTDGEFQSMGQLFISHYPYTCMYTCVVCISYVPSKRDVQLIQSHILVGRDIRT